MGRIGDRYRENWHDLMVTGGRFGRLKMAFLILAGITALLWTVVLVLNLIQ